MSTGYFYSSSPQSMLARALSLKKQAKTSSVGNGSVTTSSDTPTSSTGAGSVAPSTASYQAMIQNDPIYQQAGKDLSAQGVGDASSLAAAIKRMYIQSGINFDPGSMADSLGLTGAARDTVAGSVDAQTRGLAQTNTNEGLSTFSRLAAQNTNNVRDLKAALASRGMLESGELPYNLASEELRYKQAQTDFRQQVLDAINGAVGGYVTNSRQRTSALQQALQDAATRQAGFLGPTQPPAANTEQTAPPAVSRDPGLRDPYFYYDSTYSTHPQAHPQRRF